MSRINSSHNISHVWIINITEIITDLLFLWSVLCPHAILIRRTHAGKEVLKFYYVCTLILILQCRTKSIYARKYHVETRDLSVFTAAVPNGGIYMNTAEFRIMVHDQKWHMQCQKTLFIAETGLTHLCFTWMYGWWWLPRIVPAHRDCWEENLSFIFAKFPLAEKQWRGMLCWSCAAHHCSQAFFIYRAHCLSLNLLLWTGTKRYLNSLESERKVSFSEL